MLKHVQKLILTLMVLLILLEVNLDSAGYFNEEVFLESQQNKTSNEKESLDNVTQMGIVLSQENILIGDTLIATIYIDPIVPIGGWEIYLLTFNPNLVQANEVIPGNEWFEYFSSGNINNVDGEITETQAYKIQDLPNYNHTACEIFLTATNPGICNINLVTVEATNEQFEIIDVETNNITFNIRLPIYVDDDNTEGPWDGTLEHPYQYIQEGVNAASSDDTVFVCNGTYYEHVYIDKSIKLIGENPETTIIDSYDGCNDIVTITADNVTLNGFTVQNSTCFFGFYYYAVKIISENNIIDNNIITNNVYAMGISSSNNIVSRI